MNLNFNVVLDFLLTVELIAYICICRFFQRSQQFKKINKKFIVLNIFIKHMYMPTRLH